MIRSLRNLVRLMRIAWVLARHGVLEPLEAVAEALARADRGILVELLRGLQRADAASSVEWVLLEKVRAARDAFLDAEKEAWTTIEPPPAPSADLPTARREGTDR